MAKAVGLLCVCVTAEGAVTSVTQSGHTQPLPSLWHRQAGLALQVCAGQQDAARAGEAGTGRWMSQRDLPGVPCV